MDKQATARNIVIRRADRRPSSISTSLSLGLDLADRMIARRKSATLALQLSGDLHLTGTQLELYKSLAWDAIRMAEASTVATVDAISETPQDDAWENAPDDVYDTPQDDDQDDDNFTYVSDADAVTTEEIIRARSYFDEGVRYESATSDEQEIQKAYLSYRNSLKCFESWFLIEIATSFFSCDEGLRDYDKAALLYGVAAETGDPHALNNLGVMYSKGYGVPIDLQKSLGYFETAASIGHAQAAYNLAWFYDNGVEVEKDTETAVIWLDRASRLGDEDAQYWLGHCYSEGIGVEVDERVGLSWFRKAAEQDHLRAQFRLSNLLRSGRGCIVDENEALHWCKSAAHKGHPKAQHNVGVSYDTGSGVAINLAEAARWYELAAKQGVLGSQIRLAEMYEDGYGVSVDFHTAAYWYEMAANGGNGAAQDGLDRCRLKLKP